MRGHASISGRIAAPQAHAHTNVGEVFPDFHDDVWNKSEEESGAHFFILQMHWHGPCSKAENVSVAW